MFDDYKTSDGRVFYWLTNLPYTRKDGVETEIAVWHSECVDCGAPFTVASPIDYSKSNVFYRTKCDTHKMTKEAAAKAWGKRMNAYR
jgi:hypothetical protein